MGASNQGMTPCDVLVNLSEADDETISQWTYSDIQANFTFISRLIILLVGLVGNGAFLVVVARVRSMQTLVNAYLVNLALADVLVLLQHTAVPIAISTVVHVPSYGHLFGAAGCMATIFFKYLGYFTSIILVCLMSTERFLAVCHPLKHRSINTKSRASKLIAFAWILGAGFSACAIPIRTQHTKICIEWPDDTTFDSYPSYTGRCASPAEWAIHVFDVIQAVPFFSALICNAIFFTKIIHNLQCREDVNRSRGPIHGCRVARITHQVTRMLLVNGAVFFFCHAPFQSLSLCMMVATVSKQDLFSNSVAQDITLNVFRILVFANSAINPLVYNATNSRYRRAFVRVFLCSSKARARTGTSHSTMSANRFGVRLDDTDRQNSNGSILNGIELLEDKDLQQIQITKF